MNLGIRELTRKESVFRIHSVSDLAVTDITSFYFVLARDLPEITYLASNSAPIQIIEKEKKTEILRKKKFKMRNQRKVVLETSPTRTCHY